MDWQKLRQSVIDGLNESPVLDRQFYGNPVIAWLVAAVAFVILLFLLRLIVGVARRRAGTAAEQHDYLVAHAAAGMAAAIKPWFRVIVSLYLGTRLLDLSHTADNFLQWVMATALLLQFAFWADVLIALFLKRYVQQRMETDAAAVTTMSALGFFGRLAAWVLALLLVLQNSGVEVSALVAGLGIGGVAVALAAQSVLGDLFAALAIVLDKPFILGDFIAVNEFLGTVEHIGLKTTRLRSLTGEQLIFGNADLLHGRIRNYKRMYQRRVEFTFNIEYATEPDKLAAMPDMIREAITSQERTRFDRAHFKSFGECSLLFESVYYVLTPDYNIYMDIQHAINLTLMRRFAEAGIRFAVPTQVVSFRRESPA